jgi:predicted nucleic-acid-binding Zn-ribbon protein
MDMYFENLLDAVFGIRKIFHVAECEVCGFDEVYYEDAETKKLVGRACSHCNFVQKFDF